LAIVNAGMHKQASDKEKNSNSKLKSPMKKKK